MLSRLALALLSTTLLTASAAAHEITSSIFDLALSPGHATVTLGVHAHLVDLAVAADVDRDGNLTQRELDDAHDALAIYLDARLAIRSDAPCGRTALTATPTARGGARIALAYTCNSKQSTTFTLDNGVFFDLLPKHTFIGVLTTTVDGATQRYQLAFDTTHRHLHHDLAPGAPTPLPVASTASVIGSYLVLGVEHIVGGLDHLVFVFTIIVVARRLREVAWLVSAFTLAHSVTLTLAALDLVTLPSSFVEPAIALSILTVAVLNASGKAHPHPWLVFAFGLLHGFGFAGALAETGLPSDGVAWALGAFNVGVELGQLALVSLVWPLVLLVARRATWYRALVLASSLVVSVLALIWFIERVA